MLLKQKSEKKRRSFLFYIALLCVFVFTLVQVIYMRIEISQKRTELQSITDELDSVNVANEQLKRYSSEKYQLEYIEQIARDQLDYSYSDEIVYYFIPQ